MKTLQTRLGGDLVRGVDYPEELEPHEYLLDNLLMLVELANPEGLSRDNQRRLKKISDKWAEGEVELSEPEYDLLLTSVEEAKPPARTFKLANAIYDLFELE